MKPTCRPNYRPRKMVIGLLTVSQRLSGTLPTPAEFESSLKVLGWRARKRSWRPSTAYFQRWGCADDGLHPTIATEIGRIFNKFFGRHMVSRWSVY